MIQNFNVFGRKEDLIIFVGPLLLAIPYGIACYYFSLHYPVQLFHIGWMIILDTPHVYAGLAMMSVTQASRSLRSKMIVTMIIVAAIFTALSLGGNSKMAGTIFVHLSAWHFIRQSQTWQMIALKRRDDVTKNEYWINLFAINAVTWGPLIYSLSQRPAFGWYSLGDMILLPVFLQYITLPMTILGILLYIVYYLRNKKLSWNSTQHLIFMSITIAWGLARFFPSTYWSASLIVLPHGIPYLYLLFRYTNNKIERRKFILSIICIGFIFGSIFQVIESGVINVHLSSKGIEFLFIFMIITTTLHYLLDKIFWSSKNNPNWSKGVLEN